MSSIKTCVNHRMRNANKQCTGCQANLCKYCGQNQEDGIWCDNCKHTLIRNKRTITL